MYYHDQWITVKQNHQHIANIHRSHENPGGGNCALQQIHMDGAAGHRKHVNWYLVYRSAVSPLKLQDKLRPYVGHKTWPGNLC